MSNSEPIFLPSNDKLDNVVVRLAFQIKGVAFAPITDMENYSPDTPAHIAASTAPRLFDGEKWHKGLVAIFDFLENHNQQHSLFPNGNKGMPIALNYWSKQFYKDGNKNSINQHLSLISRQLNDGRNFLQGAEPGLADVFSYAPIKLLSEENNAPPQQILAIFPLLERWLQNMGEIDNKAL